MVCLVVPGFDIEENRGLGDDLRLLGLLLMVSLQPLLRDPLLLLASSSSELPKRSTSSSSSSAGAGLAGAGLAGAGLAAGFPPSSWPTGPTRASGRGLRPSGRP